MAQILDFGDGISGGALFVPYGISESHMGMIFQNVPEYLKTHARTLMKDHSFRIFAVNQTCGRMYWSCENRGRRVITIPVWAIEYHLIKHDPKQTMKQWYIAHEFAHAYDYIAGGYGNHGPSFMEQLKRICPPEAIHHELGYKPRNAMAAGISLKL